MKAGYDYEKLVEQIYKELHTEAIVTFNDHIYGHLTEINRQIDVSIRFTVDGVGKLIIVQAKDWEAKVDIKTVGEFISVIEDVQADSGIIVSRSGFSGTAIPYAGKKKIEVLSAHSAMQKKWALELNIPVIRYEDIYKLDYKFKIHFPAAREVKFKIANPEFMQNENKVHINEAIWRALNHNAPIKTGETVTLTIKNKDLLCNQINGEWHPVLELQFQYKFTELKISSCYFNPSEYRALKDHSSNKLTPTFVLWEDIMLIIKDSAQWVYLDPNHLDFDDSKTHAVIFAINFPERVYSLDLHYVQRKG